MRPSGSKINKNPEIWGHTSGFLSGGSKFGKDLVNQDLEGAAGLSGLPLAFALRDLIVSR